MSVGHTDQLCKNAEPIKMLFGGLTCGSKVLDGVQHQMNPFAAARDEKSAMQPVAR